MGPTFDGVAAPFVLAGYMPFICVYCFFSSRQGQSSSWFPLTLSIWAFSLSGTSSWLDSVRDSLVASDFCHQVGRLNRDGSFLPTDEETLIGFANNVYSWLTTWPTHLLKYTCQWYAPFTWPWLVGSFHQLPLFAAFGKWNIAAWRSSVTQMLPYNPGSSADDSAWTGLLRERPSDAVGGMLFGFLQFLTCWGVYGEFSIST